ncbi:hypothetical protein [Streptomyces sp. YGL11-2]|uniref:hypothetical protein n=1 Tax=Streptomyces sp. YGL11-2 TaxID=3414028 RepID=UPI003CEC9BC5
MPHGSAPVRHTVTLADDLRPAIDPGHYTIEVSQDVTPHGPSQVSLTGACQEFVVESPQFTLDSASIYAQYPPPGATGDFSTVLPHITLNQATRPWERSITSQRDESHIPWLALLVVTDGSLVADPDTRQWITTRPVQSLKGTAPDGVVLPNLTVDDIAGVDDSCQTVDIKLAAVQDLMPLRKELRWLTHLRQVTKQGKKIAALGEGWQPGQYGVVVANRLPRTDGHYTALLVSLRGHGGYPYLQGDQPLPPRADRVRFVVLASWSFDSKARAEGTFGDVVKHLAHEAKLDPMLRLRTRPVDHPEARDRLADGYVPLVHRLHGGEDSYGWTRGPLTPVVPQNPLPPGERDAATTWTCADAALIYSEHYGLFDVSYAAAYTLGQTLALANTSLAEAVSRYRREGLRAVQQAAAAREHGLDGGSEGTRSLFDSWLAGDARMPSELSRNIQQLAKKAYAVPPSSAARARVEPVTPAPARALREMAARTAESPLAAACEAALEEVAARHRPHVAHAGLTWKDLLPAVPFSFLVPDMEMLPAESLRFFHVDPYWFDALIAGAAGQGASSATDVVLTSRLLAGAFTDEALPEGGVLIRSRLIQHWPDLVLELPSDMPAPHTFAMAPDIRLLLFPKWPQTLVLREPPHALNFGIDTSLDGKDHGAINLRWVSGEKTGEAKNEAFKPVDQCLRGISPGSGLDRPQVFNLCGTGTPLVPALTSQLKQPIAPAGLALQLMNLAYCATFKRSTT